MNPSYNMRVVKSEYVKWTIMRLTGHRDCLRWLHRRNKNTVARPLTTNRRPILELYNYARGNPALSVLGLVAELSHKPICLHQA